MQRHHLTSGLFPLAQQLSFNSINRFQFGVRLFSNRSRIKTKFGKNRKVAHEAQPIESLIFLSHFDFFCDLLHVQTHGNINVFVLYALFLPIGDVTLRILAVL